MRVIYTTEATAHGGPNGHVRSSDGILDLDLRVPVELARRGSANAQAAADGRPNHGARHAEYH